MNDVYTYFEQHLVGPPTDETLRQCPIDSPCGNDCRETIDAASILLDKIARAVGTMSDDAIDMRNDLASIVDQLVQVYWRG